MLFSGHITQLFRTGFVIWLVCEPTSAGMHWACTRWFLPLSCVTLRPSWSDSWHWFILFIMPGINLTLHPCHSRNSFISRCFDVKTMAHSVSGVRRFEDVPDWNFLLWLLSEIKTLDEGMWWGREKKKKDQQSSFHFPRLLSLAVASLTSCPHSSARAGLLISGFNETGYCHSHIWA